MKCEFWVNVNKANTTATALAANKQLLISVAHIILVNANEWSKKIPMGSGAALLYESIKVANNIPLCGLRNSKPN